MHCSTAPLRSFGIATVVVLALAVSVGSRAAPGDADPAPGGDHAHPADYQAKFETWRSFDRDAAYEHSQAVIGQSVGNFLLRNRDGDTVQTSAFRGKPLVVSMIFTSCYHICPMTTKNLDIAVEKAREALGEDSFNVVTLGFDSASDNPATMTQFAIQQGVDDSRWWFLSGDKTTIHAFADDLGFIFFPSPRGFDHLVQTTIIDADGAVYGQVYGIDFEIPLLVEPLKALVFGQTRDKSLLRDFTDRVRLFCTIYDPVSDHYRIDYSVFIGTFVGVVISIIFGYQLIREWRRSLQSDDWG